MHSEQNPSSSSSLQGPTLSPHRIPLSTLCLATPRPLRPPARPHVTAQLLEHKVTRLRLTSGPLHSRFSFWNDFSRIVIFSPVTLVSPRQSRARGAFPVYRLRVALPARHPLSPSIFCCLCPHRHPAFTASARVSRWPAGQGRGAVCSLTSGPSVPSWGPAVSRAGRVSAERAGHPGLSESRPCCFAHLAMPARILRPRPLIRSREAGARSPHVSAAVFQVTEAATQMVSAPGAQAGTGRPCSTLWLRE